MKLITHIIIISLLTIFKASYSQDFKLYRENDWLKSNDYGDRYEGIYTMPIAGRTQLISFWGGYEPYIIGEDENIHVKYFLPEMGYGYLKTEELIPSRFYWMEKKEKIGVKGWNDFSWPLNNWIQNLDVNSKNLGTLVRIGDARSKDLASTIVYTKNFPGAIKIYQAKLRLGHSISNGKAKLYAGKYDHIDNISKNETILYTENIIRKMGGSIVSLQFPVETFQNKEGWYTFVIEMQVRNSIYKAKKIFSFYHPG